MMENPEEAVSTYEIELEAGKQAARTGLTEESRIHLARAAELARDDAEAAEALARLGRAMATLGDYPEAERVLREALQRAAASPPVLALARMQMGTVRWLQGEMKTARAFLEQAQADFKRLGMTRDRALALTNLGLVLKNMGEYQRAIDALRESLQLGEALEDWPGVIINSNNLGECYCDLGALAQAEALFRRSLDLAARENLPVVSIDPTRNLGHLLAQTGELEEAARLIEQAIDMALQYQRPYLRAQALGSLAEVWLAKNDPQRAEAVAEELRDMAQNSVNYRAHARLILGRCALLRRDSTRALVVLQEGLLDAQAAFSELLILRFHAALAQVVDHPAIAQVHRRIAKELAEQMADGLADKELQRTFRASPLFRSIGA